MPVNVKPDCLELQAERSKKIKKISTFAPGQINIIRQNEN